MFVWKSFCNLFLSHKFYRLSLDQLSAAARTETLQAMALAGPAHKSLPFYCRTKPPPSNGMFLYKLFASPVKSVFLVQYVFSQLCCPFWLLTHGIRRISRLLANDVCAVKESITIQCDEHMCEQLVFVRSLSMLQWKKNDDKLRPKCSSICFRWISVVFQHHPSSIPITIYQTFLQQILKMEKNKLRTKWNVLSGIAQ